MVGRRQVPCTEGPGLLEEVVGGDQHGGGEADHAFILTPLNAYKFAPELDRLLVDFEDELLLERLGNSTLQLIAVWRMEGYTTDEIATRLGCTRRTVARKLELIRDAWKGELE